MRFVEIICSLFLCSNIFAQTPVLQWQNSYGGSQFDEAQNLIVLPDGSYVAICSSNSSNGDILGNHGSSFTTDVSVLKFGPAGNLLWQKSFGGSGSEYPTSIIHTSDGGFIFAANSNSHDGDVTGNHSAGLVNDIWLVKLDASGTIIWQKCYGGSNSESSCTIIELNNSFMVTGYTKSNDGDVSGLHSSVNIQDLWVFKTDLSGNLLWQKCYGGTLEDCFGNGYNNKTLIRQTIDGNLIIASGTRSKDGDVSNPFTDIYAHLWVLKITNTGSIIWDRCIGGNSVDGMTEVIVNADGTFFMSGCTLSNNLPGSSPGNNFDAWALKLDAAGNVLWLKAFGGSDNDFASCATSTPDGGYLIAGETSSKDGIVCKKHSLSELWLIKMDASGNIQWSRTFGGNMKDGGLGIVISPSGECIVLSTSYSADGDLTENKGYSDLWLARFSFTGKLSYPGVHIASKTDSILCSGNSVKFFATPIDGGTKPVYQWLLNGVNIGGNADSIHLSNLHNLDSVSCTMTSNSPCVDIKTAYSNTVKVKVDLRLPPRFSLPADTALCSYERITLSTRAGFSSYLWSNNSSNESITVKQPGIYWLEVTDKYGCTARDSITISPKSCIEGIFVPNAFTPNRDGHNDLFMPIMNVDVKTYKFMVFDRWGRVVFQTTTLNKGWDGKVNGLPYDTGVFAWQCQYQLDGEEPAAKRGTVLLLR